jgi:23S rRNA (uridine2552-2'-O)-methyltransferase
MRVLDAGAAPGSWTQVASQLIGERGAVVAVDLKAIDPRGMPAHARLLQGDFRSIGLDDFGGAFDAIISDMAPDTSGVPSADAAISARLCHSLLDRARDLLAPGGALAMKVFEGADYPDLLARAKRLFREARGFKPAASRAESVEIFIVCTGFKGADAEPLAAPARVRPSPAPGWRGG